MWEMHVELFLWLVIKMQLFMNERIVYKYSYHGAKYSCLGLRGVSANWWFFGSVNYCRFSGNQLYSLKGPNRFNIQHFTYNILYFALCALYALHFQDNLASYCTIQGTHFHYGNKTVLHIKGLSICPAVWNC